MSLRIELDELEIPFRERAMKKFGYEKGSLKKAAMEAIRHWVDGQKDMPESKEPFSLIQGMLEQWKGKTNAVQLQHAAARLWTK